MRSSAQLPNLTVAEYLEGELHSQVKHEYVAGQVFAMTGASRRHNLISLNLTSALREVLRGGPCQVFMTDVKVHVASANAYYYPDLVVTCDPRDVDPYFVNRPCLIVEVLSPSTEKIDRREKLLAYRKLDSLREYVLVDPDTRELTVYRLGEQAQWWQDVYGAEGSVHLASIAADLPLAAIYEGA
jgi:Uma2 family endonuclease